MNQLKLYSALIRTFFRNCLDHKQEEEAPYLAQIIQKDDVCLHIGATDGRHSYAMAKAMKDGNGYVLAFEPSPVTFPVLDNVIKLHGLTGKIRPERKAFSDRSQILKLNIPFKTTGRLANSFGFTSAPGNPVKGRHGEENPDIISFEVEATTIDEVAKTLSRVDFIRMDIEGSERLALNGGWETIKKFRPNLLIEIHPYLLENIFNADPQTIYDDFKALGYDIYHLEGGWLTKSSDLNIRPWKDYFFINPERPNDLL